MKQEHERAKKFGYIFNEMTSKEYFKQCQDFYRPYVNITPDKGGFKGCPRCRGITRSKIDEYCYCDGPTELIPLVREYILDYKTPVNKNGTTNLFAIYKE